MGDVQAFKQGTEPGEAAWLIASAVRGLSPLAPVAFGRVGLDGKLTIDFNAMIDTACVMAVEIQKRAFEMTGMELTATLELKGMEDAGL